jgi:Fic family protein
MGVGVDLDRIGFGGAEMAVVHCQFEAIHPFTDGNGRTGRVLNILYLIQEELLNLPIQYLRLVGQTGFAVNSCELRARLASAQSRKQKSQQALTC